VGRDKSFIYKEALGFWRFILLYIRHLPVPNLQ